MKEDQISRMSPGLISCPLPKVRRYMPEVLPILEEGHVGDLDWDQYIVDVKVHMLMPGMWPCIPNWHRDFVPRDPNTLKEMEEFIDPSLRMFLWLSGPPFTEFREGGFIAPHRWKEFSQNDWHRGTKADRHGWRVMLRVADKRLNIKPGHTDYVRRHSQVYVEADFRW